MEDRSSYQYISLNPDAPAKPAYGEPCNGCGVCCGSEPCPMAVMLLHQRRGGCRALQWVAEDGCYRCGLIRQPAHYLHWLPLWLEGVVRRVCYRWVAAGTRCDSDASVME